MQETTQDLSIPQSDAVGPAPISWPRVLGLSILFSAIGSLWITATEIVFRSAQVGEAVPPVPAVATLVFLLLLRSVLRRTTRGRPLNNAEILAVYGFTTISMTVGFVNGFRQIITLGTAPYYVDQNNVVIQLVRKHWPHWIAPRDASVVKWLWQGSPGGVVPWGAWLFPLLSIGALFVLAHIMFGSLFGLLQRRWLHEERLAYPVAELATSLVEGERVSQFRETSSRLIRSPMFRLGLLGAVLFNLVWIIPALRPAATVTPQYTDLNTFLPEGPWRAGYIWFIRYNLAALGLAILVPTDVLFTVWFSTLILKAEAVILALFGHEWSTTFLLAGNQGLGGYVAEAIFLIWSARRSLRLFRKLRSGPDVTFGWSDRVWLGLFAASATSLLAWFIASGIPVWLSLSVLALLIVRVLIVARIRAQVGVPILYFHVGDARSIVFLFGGSLIAATGERSIAAFTAFSILSISAFLAPYQSDGYKLAETSRLGGGRWMALSVLAVAVGFVFAAVTQLYAYYTRGGEILGWGTDAWPVASVVGGVIPANMEASHWPSMAVGFVTTSALILAQRVFTWWPLHPVGFLVGCAIGGYVFGPALIAWGAKVLSLRYWGLPGYNRTRELFLGLVMGHFGVATLWGLLGALNFEPVKRYIIGFW